MTAITVMITTPPTTPTIIPMIAPVDSSSSSSWGITVVLGVAVVTVGANDTVSVVVGGGVVKTLEMGARTTTVEKTYYSL